MTISARIVIILLTAGFLVSSCGHSRKLKKTFPAAEEMLNQLPALRPEDSASAKQILERLATSISDYSTFQARVKVHYADAAGSQPEATVLLRMQKDSAIWLSVSGTLLNLELYRILITPDSVTILHKLDKTVEYLPFTFLQDFIRFPLTFSTLQDLIIGNVLYAKGTITGFQSTGTKTTISVADSYFTNVIQADSTGALQTSSILDNQSLTKRALHLSYESYQPAGKYLFATERHLRVDDESKIQIAMSFQKPEFNNELSLTFNVPANYKPK